MPSLRLSDGRTYGLRGLGKNKSLSTLSEKRITKAARKRLRAEFGDDKVEVSCFAVIIDDDRWQGRCTVYGRDLTFTIKSSPDS
jgi:hypothetical protein